MPQRSTALTVAAELAAEPGAAAARGAQAVGALHLGSVPARLQPGSQSGACVWSGSGGGGSGGGGWGSSSIRTSKAASFHNVLVAVTLHPDRPEGAERATHPALGRRPQPAAAPALHCDQRRLQAAWKALTGPPGPTCSSLPAASCLRSSLLPSSPTGAYGR